jgi:hypothetical protein
MITLCNVAGRLGKGAAYIRGVSRMQFPTPQRHALIAIADACKFRLLAIDGTRITL